MDTSLILFCIGSTLIFLGANLLIDNSKSVASSLGISPIVIGLTVVALGTSLPELVVSVLASLKNETDVVIGNVLGSNISNIALVLAVILFIKPIISNYTKISNDIIFLILSTVIFSVLLIMSALHFIVGLFLLLLFVLFIINQFRAINKDPQSLNENKDSFKYLHIFYIFIGIGMLGYGSDLFISGAIGIAISLGVPVIVISLSVVALGTSLPELVTSIIAIRKNEPSFVIGNIIGSNIINILLVLGLSIAINPIYENPTIYISVGLLLLVTLLFFLLVRYKKNLSKFDGMILFSMYLVFIYCNFIFQT